MSDERPVSDVFPAFNGIKIGRDGTIWIQEYPRPGSPTTQVWTSFDSSGRIGCSVSLDASEVYEFGADYVLVEHRDDLGVERVQLYPLSPPVD